MVCTLVPLDRSLVWRPTWFRSMPTRSRDLVKKRRMRHGARKRLRPWQIMRRSEGWLVDGVWVPPGGGLSAPAHLQLLQDIMHVVLDRRGTDRQLTRDVLVGATLIHERQDFALARREGRQRRWLGFLQEVGEAIEHRRRDVRRAMHAALYRVHHGTMQLVGAAFAGDIAGEPGSCACEDSVIDLVQRKGHEPGAGISGLDQPS